MKYAVIYEVTQKVKHKVFIDESVTEKELDNALGVVFSSGVVKVSDIESAFKDSLGKKFLGHSKEIEIRNEDNMFRFKFDSSDIEGKLKVGQTYKFTVVGYRFPFFSWYENIIKVDDATK